MIYSHRLRFVELNKHDKMIYLNDKLKFSPKLQWVLKTKKEFITDYGED